VARARTRLARQDSGRLIRGPLYRSESSVAGGRPPIAIPSRALEGKFAHPPRARRPTGCT
jgi:hypothetical protein